MTTEVVVFQSTPIITFGYIMQVFFSLLVVIAVIYLVSKYVLPRLKASSTTGKIIKITDRVYLEPQVAAYILQVGQSAWLIAVSNKQIARIDKIDPENLVT